MNQKSYSRVLTVLALVFVPVPSFSESGIDAVPMSLLLFQTVKLGFHAAGETSDLGIQGFYLIIFAGMVVYSLICGAIILAIFRWLNRWTSSIKSPKLKRAAAVALLCLPVALTLAPVYRWDQAAPKNLWMAIREEFTREEWRTPLPPDP